MTDTNWHQTTLRIPFTTPEHATIARRVILVDRELNAHLVERELTVEGNDLVATYKTATARLLRLATNGFIENLQLVIRTIHEFAPSPSAVAHQEAEQEQPAVVDEAVKGGIRV